MRAYLDRDFHLYHLPRESIERLGKVDAGTGDAGLIDGHVAARAERIEVDGETVTAWTVGYAGLVVRSANTRA